MNELQFRLKLVVSFPFQRVTLETAKEKIVISFCPIHTLSPLANVTEGLLKVHVNSQQCWTTLCWLQHQTEIKLQIIPSPSLTLSGNAEKMGWGHNLLKSQSKDKICPITTATITTKPYRKRRCFTPKRCLPLGTKALWACHFPFIPPGHLWAQPGSLLAQLVLAPLLLIPTLLQKSDPSCTSQPIFFLHFEKSIWLHKGSEQQLCNLLKHGKKYLKTAAVHFNHLSRCRQATELVL